MRIDDQSPMKLDTLIEEIIAVADAIEHHAVAALLEHARELLVNSQN